MYSKINDKQIVTLMQLWNAFMECSKKLMHKSHHHIAAAMAFAFKIPVTAALRPAVAPNFG
jgi:hypothetical protein